MNKNKSKEKDKIETLEIKLRHLENQHFVVKEQYEKTTGEYFKILGEISNANKQLQQEIAERKKADEALRKVHDELEIRVQERTAELAKTNEELKNYISELKKTEKKIKKYKFLVDSAHDAIFFKDLESRYVIANDKTLESFGLSREEVIGKNDYELMPIKGEAKKNIEDDQLVFKTGKLTEIIKHMTGADRKEYWFQAIKVPQFDEKGNIIGLVGIARDITEQKKAAEVIKKARDDYLAITNLTGDIIVNVDKEGKWTFLNDGACEFWGKPREELMSNAFADYMHPDDHEKTMTAIQEMIERKKILRGHVNRQKTPKGWRIVEWNAAPLFDKSGDYWGMQATGRDITEHQKAVEALKESEEKYRKVIENIYDIVYSSYADGTLYFVSPNILSITGYKQEEIIGSNIIEEFVHPDDREHVLSDYEKTMKTGEEFPTIFRLSKKDGSYLYVEEFGKIVREGDKIVGLTGVLRDITGRKRAEEALRESEMKFRSLFESATEFIHILDRDGKILQTNPVVTLRSGYTEDEMVGRSLAEFFTPASQKIFARQFPILMEERCHRIEIEFVCKDGTIIISDCSCMVVRDERGEFAYIVTFMRDITERKKAEEKLKFTQKELEIKAKNLEETNTALKVLLKHQDTEKNIIEKNILTSLKTLVLPYLEKIKIGNSDERQNTYVNIIETNLSEITKPFTSKLTVSYSKLTPTEIQITSLIRENKTAKDIARILNISETTVFFHRRNIRKKFGLKNKKANLLSYLQSIASD